MLQVKELTEKFEVLKPPSQFGMGSEGRISQRDIMSSAISERLLHQIYLKEIYIQGHPQWTGSWTELSTYQYITGSVNTINFDDYPDVDWHFEMIGFTDAGTGYWRVYNSTLAEAVGNSELSTTVTGAANSVRLRTKKLVKPSGTNTLKIQHYISGGNGTTEKVNSVMSRYIFRLP